MTRALLLTLLLAGCGKIADVVSTGMDGYSLRCIEGTRYVLLSSEHGLAVTPLLGTDGLPKSCTQGEKK
jgi:hypothetical protein